MAAKKNLTKAEETQKDVQFWTAQLEDYDKDFRRWKERSDKIVYRYRDETETGDMVDNRDLPRYNILYSNISILQPAIYNQTPIPMVERRNNDNDPVARLASEMLQRTLAMGLEQVNFDEPIEQSRDDRLFSGRGTVWLRYEADFGDPIESTPADTPENDSDDDTEGSAQPTYELDEKGEPLREVTGERVCLDYVAYGDFRHSPAKRWKDVWWVSRDLGMSKDEVIELAGEKIANQLKYADALQQDKNSRDTAEQTGGAKVTKITEIWNRKTKKIIFISKGLKTGPVLVKDYPLDLSGGFPCPKPAYGIMTNNSLVPVPDYAMYQDQAMEIDELTGRMAALTRACQVKALVDSKAGIAANQLFTAEEMSVIPINDMVAKYTTGGAGGIAAYMQFLPVEEFAKTITLLQPQRQNRIEDVYVITGMSDIMRGDVDPNETATATANKTAFGSLRLKKMQRGFQNYIRDIMRIMAEIMCEQFQLQTVIDMSNIMEIGPDKPKNMQPMIPDPNQPPPQPGMPPMPPQMIPNTELLMYEQQMQAFKQLLEQAWQLLKDDNQRTFRVDIETDSTIGLIEQENKQDMLDFTRTVGGLLQQAIPAINTTPALAPFLKDVLMLTMRQFKAGRTTEAAFEESLDNLVAQTAQPKPPPPSPALQVAQIKEQGENQRAQLDAQTETVKAKVEMQKAGVEAQSNQLKAAGQVQDTNAQVRIAEITAQGQVAAAAAKAAGDPFKHDYVQ